MISYCKTACNEFADERGHKFKSAPTPYAPDLPRGQVEVLEAQPGVYADSCAHHLMKLLYAARQAKLEVIVAITRLASKITKWCANCDRKLIRLFDFLNTNSNWCLSGSLSKNDREDVEVWCWPDGDLSGDPDESSKSTSGRYIELRSKSGNRFPIGWATHKQGASSNSTPEAETVSLADSIRLDGLAIQSLFAMLLKRPVVLRCLRTTRHVSESRVPGIQAKCDICPERNVHLWGSCMRFSMDLRMWILDLASSNTTKVQHIWVTISLRRYTMHESLLSLVHASEFGLTLSCQRGECEFMLSYSWFCIGFSSLQCCIVGPILLYCFPRVYVGVLLVFV